MRKLVVHCTAPRPLPEWSDKLAEAGFVQLDIACWRHGDFVLRLEFEEDLWLHGEGASLAPEAVAALLRAAMQASAGGELELFEEDGRLLQRHSF